MLQPTIRPIFFFFFNCLVVLQQPATDPYVQGWTKYFFLKKSIKKIKFSSQNCFSQNFKAWNLLPQKTDKNVLFFIKYSWQALLLCNKPFDLLKILVFDFIKTKEKFDRLTLSFSDTNREVQPKNYFFCSTLKVRADFSIPRMEYY